MVAMASLAGAVGVARSREAAARRSARLLMAYLPFRRRKDRLAAACCTGTAGSDPFGVEDSARGVFVATLRARTFSAWLTECFGEALTMGSPEFVACATWDEVGIDAAMLMPSVLSTLSAVRPTLSSARLSTR